MGSADLAKELYLVTQIVRVGRILSTDGARRAAATGVSESYRRPLGAGVLPLTDILNTPAYHDEREYNFKVQSSFVINIRFYLSEK